MNLGGNSEIQKIPKIVSFFGIGLPEKVFAITEGIGNHNYLINTSGGDYIVKFLMTQTPKGIENDIAIQNQLIAAGIRTSTYIQNKNGEYIYYDRGEHAVVSKNIEGVTPLYANRKLAFEIGKILAIFHQKIINLPHPHKGWMNPDTVDIHSKEAKDLFSKPLPAGITHGDLHLGNVLIDPEKPDFARAILDFEEAGNDLFIVDLARSILGVCYSMDGNSLVPELIESEILGYESVRKLNEEERTLLPQAIKHASDACIKWFIKNGYEKYVESHRRRAASFKIPK